MNEAKTICNDCLITDPQFPFKEAFELLPDELAALIECMADLQTKIDCSLEIDPSVSKINSTLNITSNKYNRKKKCIYVYFLI